MKKKAIVLIVTALITSLAFVLIAVWLYSNTNISTMGKRGIQNVTYLLMLLSTFLLMKTSKKPLRDFGLCKNHIPRQIIIGVVIAIIFLAVMFGVGWRPYLKENFIYIVVSQLLVAFTEELLFRGFILTMLKDVVTSKNMAVFFMALLFGLWHYPLGQNVGVVISTFIVGAIYGALRTVFSDADEISVPSLAIAHWIYNVMI